MEFYRPARPILRGSWPSRSERAFFLLRLSVSTKTEERQDCDHDNNEADYVNDAVHGGSFYLNDDETLG